MLPFSRVRALFDQFHLIKPRCSKATELFDGAYQNFVGNMREYGTGEVFKNYFRSVNSEKERKQDQVISTWLRISNH
jgi:hypothetical protein